MLKQIRAYMNVVAVDMERMANENLGAVILKTW